MALQNGMTRKEATETILAAKREKGLTFEDIGKAVGRHKVWVTAALMGQGTMSKEEAEKAVKALGLENAAQILRGNAFFHGCCFTYFFDQ